MVKFCCPRQDSNFCGPCVNVTPTLPWNRFQPCPHMDISTTFKINCVPAWVNIIFQQDQINLIPEKDPPPHWLQSIPFTVIFLSRKGRLSLHLDSSPSPTPPPPHWMQSIPFTVIFLSKRGRLSLNMDPFPWDLALLPLDTIY